MRIIWLLIDPHNLNGILDPYLENILNGIGLYVNVLSYILIVMLW